MSEVEGSGAGPQCPRNSGGSQRKLALGMSMQDPVPVASEWAQAAPQRRHSGTGAQYWDFEQEPKGEKPQSRDESSVMGNVIRGVCVAGLGGVGGVSTIIANFACVGCRIPGILSRKSD